MSWQKRQKNRNELKGIFYNVVILTVNCNANWNFLFCSKLWRCFGMSTARMHHNCVTEAAKSSPFFDRIRCRAFFKSLNVCMNVSLTDADESSTRTSSALFIRDTAYGSSQTTKKKKKLDDRRMLWGSLATYQALASAATTSTTWTFCFHLSTSIHGNHVMLCRPLDRWCPVFSNQLQWDIRLWPPRNNHWWCQCTDRWSSLSWSGTIRVLLAYWRSGNERKRGNHDISALDIKHRITHIIHNIFGAIANANGVV